ncbi:MAG: hypothetical protein ACI4AK_01125 [Lepagella sp.]
MKKLATILLTLLLGVSLAYAGDNPLRLKSGTLAPLKNQGGTISVTLDFSKTKGNRKPLEEYITQDFGSSMEAFHRYEPEMLEWFVDRWNDDIEEGPRAVRSGETSYQLKVVTKTLQIGSRSGYGGGSSISGYALFYRTGEQEPFAEVEILKMYGTFMGGAMMGLPGLKQVYNDLAEYLCDLIYHYK